MQSRSPLLPLPLLLTAALIAYTLMFSVAGAGQELVLQLEYSRVFNISGRVNIYCAARVSGSRVLIAGSIGVPPKPYAAILADGKLEPLTLPIPEDAVKGEVTGCVWTPKGLVMYGYVTDANLTPHLSLWLYSRDTLENQVLDKVIVKPLFILPETSASYVAGYLGECEKAGSLAIAYTLLKPLSELMRGNYTGYVFAPGGIVKEHVMLRIANVTFVCGYFTAIFLLTNTSTILLGHGVTVDGAHVGYLLTHNSMLQGKPLNAKILPFVPLSAADTGDKLVAAGFMIGREALPAVLAIDREGDYRLTRINLGNAESARFTSISCIASTCIAGGEIEAGGKKTPILTLLVFNGTRVDYAHTYLAWGGEVNAVLLTPDNSVYALISKKEDSRTVLTLLKLNVVRAREAEGGIRGGMEGISLLDALVLMLAGAGGIALALYIARQRTRRA